MKSSGLAPGDNILENKFFTTKNLPSMAGYQKSPSGGAFRQTRRK
jgi:hypothetical protein